MLYIFRRGMKQWKHILWVVIISFPLGALSYWIFRKPMPSEIKVAVVNNLPIYLNEYQQELIRVQMKIDWLRYYAKMQGLPVELLFAFEGLQNPPELAMRELIKERLVDPIHTAFNLQLDSDYVAQQIGQGIPQYLLGPTGRIDKRKYRDYLRRLHLTMHEYENFKENELKRDLILQVAANALHVPRVDLREQFANDTIEKSFHVLKVPFAYFLTQVEKKPAKEEDIQSYFKEHREVYRVSEKRKAVFWALTKDAYLKTIMIDEETITIFYEKNKHTLFRIPPQVKIRRLLLAVKESEAQEEEVARKDRAEQLRKEAQAKPDTFASLVKKYSEDVKTAPKGGMIDFFKRGSYDPSFETVAFRLKEAGEISEVVKTGAGFEILQLVERKPARSKSLDAVREEIVDSLKSRKVQHAIKSDLAKVMYQLRTKSEALELFADKHNLSTKETDWVAEEDGEGYTQEALLAKQLFTKKKLRTNYGYFSHQDTYILYREIERKKSSIPPLKQLKEVVRKDYYAAQAREALKTFVKKKAKKELLAGKITLDNVGQKIGEEVHTTGMIRQDSTVYKEVPGFLARAFVLIDPQQLLTFKAKPDYYIVRLEKMGELDEEKFKSEHMGRFSSGKSSKKQLFLSAFIASLLRNATIEKHEKWLKDVSR